MIFKFLKKQEKDLNVLNVIEIKNMGELKMRISSVSRTLQTAFGLPWGLSTAESDDEKAFALVIAGIYEMGGEIVSNDENVVNYVNELMTRQANNEFLKEEK